MRLSEEVNVSVLVKDVCFSSAGYQWYCGGVNRFRLKSEGELKPGRQDGARTDSSALLRSGAGDEKIRMAMKETIYTKPAHHLFREGRHAEETLETKEMSRIGG